MRQASFGFLMGLGIIVSAGSATAGPITWQPVQTVSGDSDVKTLGTIVQAYNVGDSNVPATTTVNGVTFTGVDVSSSTNNPSAAPNYSASFGSDTISNIESNFNGAIYPGFAPSGLSANYTAILAGAAFDDVGTGGGTLTLSLGGLTNGQLYALQFWVADGRGNNRSETLTAGNTSSSLNFGTGNAVADAQYDIGMFIATGTTEVITINSLQSAQINAFTLATVPEPSSMVAICGLGAMGIFLFARRRRQVQMDRKG
jgi:hypothetical protein